MFWYQRYGKEGQEFVVVTTQGAKSLTFDHARIARSLSDVLGGPSSGNGLPALLTHAQLNDDLTHLTGQIDKNTIDCNVTTLQCRAFDTPVPTPELMASPDRRWVVLTREDNLFVRELVTGHEHQLTTDGAPFYSGGKTKIADGPWRARG